MTGFPFGYVPVEPSTWGWLSSLLVVALFFKFNRFWSFRNLDLLLITLLAPGLLMVHYGNQEHQSGLRERQADSTPTETPALPEGAGLNEEAVPSAETPEPGRPGENSEEIARRLSKGQRLERNGYLWLFGMGLVWMVRLLYDPSIRRKPMLESNLSIGGLIFLAASLMIFLMANVVTSRPTDLSGARGAIDIARRTSTDTGEQLQKFGPGYPMLHLIPAIPLFVERNVQQTGEPIALLDVARIMAILSQLAIVAGLVLIGYRHFGNLQMGFAMATIFLLLPYTAQFAGDSMHLMPGALMVWAIASYRLPVVAGILVGLAAGVCYYPFFLLPLWISYYWLRGRTRFALGFLGAITVVVSSLVFTSADLDGFFAQLQSIFGFIIPRHEGLGGIWALDWDSWFRLPFLVVFIVLCVSYAFWPVQKDLATLISCTAASMVAVQFWHGQGGGLYLAWYVPLVLLVSFRPNLDDKIAMEVLGPPRDELEAEPAA
jgi:hypothetical protein